MKKIIEYLPVISAMLLFVGFLNYSSFYRFFDIEIIQYLTAGELILSFLPLAIPILIFVFVISLLVLSQLIPMPGDSKSSESTNERFSFLTIFLAAETFKSIRQQLNEKKTPGNITPLVLLCVIFLLGVAIILFFIFAPFQLLPLVLESKLLPDWDRGFISILSVIWFLLIFDVIMVMEKKRKIRYASWINLFFLFYGFIFFISLSNKMEATDILQGKPDYSVKFEFQGKPVETDSNNIYIGRTTEYLFLRNLSQKSNAIYLCSEIKHIEIIKMNYKKTNQK